MKSKNGPFRMKKTPAKHTGGKLGMAGSVASQLGGKNPGTNVYNPNQTGGMFGGALGGALGMLGGRGTAGIGKGAFFPSAGMFGGRNTDINQLNNYAGKAANTQRSRVKPRPKRRKRRGFLSRIRSFF